jgi:hypothetical protein
VTAPQTPTPSEFDKFDAAMRRILSVSHEELERRKGKWNKQRKRKKRAKP